MRKDGEALGLPVTLVVDKDGCEIAAVEGGVKWDSAEAQALVGARAALRPPDRESRVRAGRRRRTRAPAG